MPTLRQLLRNPRKKKQRALKNFSLHLGYNTKKKKKYLFKKRPQIKGIVKKVLVMKPKKPNSANRSCATVILSNKQRIFAYIPGEKHSIQDFSSVLVTGRGVQDVPGVSYRIIRGKFDAKPVENRKQGRSLYGRKKK